MPGSVFIFLTAAGAAVRSGPIGIPDAPGIPWLRIFLALILCIAVSVAAILALRRYGEGGLPAILKSGLKGISTDAQLEIIETRRASVHGNICLFHYNGHAYVVAITAGGATMIDKLPLDTESPPGS